MKLSIVVPCYNEELNIPTFYSEVTKLEKDLPESTLFEFIFVNDGSADNTITIIKELSEKDSSVKYIDFSRNFGKEAAMLAGLEASSGDYVVVMDADLQDPPSLIPETNKIMHTNDGQPSTLSPHISFRMITTSIIRIERTQNATPTTDAIISG